MYSAQQVSLSNFLPPKLWIFLHLFSFSICHNFLNNETINLFAIVEWFFRFSFTHPVLSPFFVAVFFIVVVNSCQCYVISVCRFQSGLFPPCKKNPPYAHIEIEHFRRKARPFSWYPVFSIQRKKNMWSYALHLWPAVVAILTQVSLLLLPPQCILSLRFPLFLCILCSDLEIEMQYWSPFRN